MYRYDRRARAKRADDTEQSDEYRQVQKDLNQKYPTAQSFPMGELPDDLRARIEREVDPWWDKYDKTAEEYEALCAELEQLTTKFGRVNIERGPGIKALQDDVGKLGLALSQTLALAHQVQKSFDNAARGVEYWIYDATD